MKLVETIRTIYKELFTVSFDHSAYQPVRNILFADQVTVDPDKDTKYHFTNYEMSYQFFNETLVCFIRCNLLLPPAINPKVPFRKVNDDLRLRFLIKAGSAFLNVTDIDSAGAQQVYYFSNRVNAGASMFISSNTTGVGNSDLKNVSVVEPGESCLGVIDVFSSNAMNGNYELFTGSAQQLRSPVYRIRFKSKV